jgi:arginine repressor
MTTPASKPAAKKVDKKAAPKAGAAANKSEEVRKIATAMKEKGEQPRPSVIVAELAKKGVAVAPAQVSIVLKKMGFRPLRKRKGAKRASAPKSAAPRAAAKPAAGGVVSIDELLAAKKAAAALGGTEKAIAALQALKRIED